MNIFFFKSTLHSLRTLIIAVLWKYSLLMSSFLSMRYERGTSIFIRSDSLIFTGNLRQFFSFVDILILIPKDKGLCVEQGICSC